MVDTTVVQRWSLVQYTGRQLHLHSFGDVQIASMWSGSVENRQGIYIQVSISNQRYRPLLEGASRQYVVNLPDGESTFGDVTTLTQVFVILLADFG